MKRKLNQRVLITTLAASVILGGGAFSLLQSSAQAETAQTQTQSTATSTSEQGKKTKRLDGAGDKRGGKVGKEGRGGIVGFGGKGLIQQTATILGVDEKTLTEQVRAGQTLLQIAQAAGLTETDYLDKLIAAEKAKMNEQLSAGKITQEQADKITAELSERFKQSISSAQPAIGDRGFKGPGAGGPGVHGKGGGMGFLGNTDTLTSALGLTKEELKAAQDAGKSLSEIAAEKGITEDSLISKLKDGMTEQLKKFVQNKREPREQKRQPSTTPATPTASPAGNATNT